jgi:hypothetical protein
VILDGIFTRASLFWRAVNLGRWTVDDLIYVAVLAGLTAATGLLVALCGALADQRGEKR